MSVRTVLVWPNKILRKSSTDVDPIDDSTISLAGDLNDTMKANLGLGIAAPQVGINKNVIVINSKEMPSFPEDPVLSGCVVLINPELKTTDYSKINSAESCLSVENVSANVNRFLSVEVEYFNLSGLKNKIQVSERQSCILQHEIDHLFGKLFVDRMPQLSKAMLIKKINKVKKYQKKSLINHELKAKQAATAKRSILRAERKRKNKSKKKNR